MSRVRTCVSATIVVRREWTQGLEEVSYTAEAVLEGCAQAWTCVRHRLIQADGVQLEVLTVHWDVWSKSLQVQIAQVQLHTDNQIIT